jgi:hypothetical protein
MWELTYSDGTKVLAELKGTSWQLNTTDVVWSNEIK